MKISVNELQEIIYAAEARGRNQILDTLDRSKIEPPQEAEDTRNDRIAREIGRAVPRASGGSACGH